MKRLLKVSPVKVNDDLATHLEAIYIQSNELMH